ncbi:MAG: D-2-hydroxyacid dehydrogenase, partial [Tomitella sp.]|nr:D-2-hydroxyacid dehydrogenase [Tomitella sp.]
LPDAHPQWSIDTAMITPHMSGDAAGWRDRLAQVFIDNFAQYAAGTAPGDLRNVVDKERGYVSG